MASDSSYTTDYSSSIDSEKEKAIQTACQEIAAANRFDFHAKIGSGTFGDVFRVEDKERNVVLALKIISNEDLCQDENDFWPQLQHPNIVPLLETIKYSSAQVYLMPMMKTSLYDVVHESNFCDGIGCWKKLKKWLHQVLCGLEYMHGKQFCHLDLKADNVLISENGVAMLCDFSFIKSTTEVIEKGDFGLPSIYRPPEARPCLSEYETKVNGIAFDQWSFGIMTLEIFTDAPLSDKVDTISVSSSDSNPPPVDLWHRDLYPVLMKETQEKKFKFSVRKCFPKLKLALKECRRALEFILVFLQPHPSQRWTAERGKRHAFLEKGKLRLGRPLHEVWSKTDIPSELRTAFISTKMSSEEILIPENSTYSNASQSTSRKENMKVNVEELDSLYHSLTLKKFDENKSSNFGGNDQKRKTKNSVNIRQKRTKCLSENDGHMCKDKKST
ncbi:uncharacterized protein LOC129216653 [Uloborus diversus]|uniref:uncharacterized protein LOC129216653 n=1 Tax=Uloborus diversus TaxID=327109 RepID=UPI00240A92D9|nr:uncharacterized protein LOC129216653 [Uloborus diversus]